MKVFTITTTWKYGESVDVREAVSLLEAEQIVQRDIIDALTSTPGGVSDPAWDAFDLAHRTLTQSGGTIGRLPDGTMIEVTR